MTLPTLSTATADLENSVKEIYKLFHMPAPAVIEGCPCCIEKRGVDVLLTTPLCNLSGDQLWSYISGVFLTVGSHGDFRYLLPRILELSALTHETPGDVEIILGKLTRADWHSWSKTEQEALTQFVELWFTTALLRDLSFVKDGWIGEETESVLCGAAHAGLALDSFFKKLEDRDAAPVLAHLQSKTPRQLSPFWKDRPEAFEKVIQFLNEQTQEKT